MPTYNSAFIVLSGSISGVGHHAVAGIEAFETVVAGSSHVPVVGSTTIDGSVITNAFYVYSGPGATNQKTAFFTMNDGEKIDYLDNDEGSGGISAIQYFTLADGRTVITTADAGSAYSLSDEIAENDTGIASIYYGGSSGQIWTASSVLFGETGLIPDGVVEGTTGDDQIDATYADDPHNERVDNNDAPGTGGNEDSIIGGGGNDTINAGAGNDTIQGDGTLPSGGASADGDDLINAGAGDDMVQGGGGSDTIYGGDGSDSLSGGSGDDVIYGDVENTAASAGAEFQLNTTTATNQSGPVVEATPDGGFFAAWYDNAIGNNSATMRVHGQFFDANGSAVGPEIAIGTSAVEGSDSFDQPMLDLTVLSNGDVAVSWASDGTVSGDGGGSGVVGSVIDSSTQTAGAEFQLNSGTSTNQSGPVVEATANGGFFAAWYDNATGDGSSSMLVHGQFFDANGNAIGAEIPIGDSRVEGSDSFDQPVLDVTVLNNGNVTVSWVADGSISTDGGGSGVSGVVVDSATQTAGLEFTLNTTTATNQSGPVIEATANGGFFAAWYDDATNNNTTTMQVHGKFFDADGVAMGPQFAIGTSAVEGMDAQDQPVLDVTVLSNGDVAVSWVSDGTVASDGHGTGVVGAVIDSSTQTAGTEFQLNTSTNTHQSGPVTEATPDGGFFAAWYDNATGNNSATMQVRGQFFDANGNKVGQELEIGTSPAEGSDFFDQPMLDLTVLSNGDVAVSWVSDGTAAVDGGGSAVSGSIVTAPSSGTGTGDDIIDGGDGDDTIYGNAGDDRISGGAGDDELYGDTGISTPAITVETISNGNFSSGLSGWTVSNPTGGHGPTSNGGGTASFNGAQEAVYGDSIEQDFAASVGTEHNVSLNLIEADSGTGDHTFQIDILDDAGNTVASETHTVSDGTTLPVNFSFIATTEVSTIRITNTTSSNSINTDGHVDDVSITYVDNHAGNDTLDGGDGDDTIFGDGGDDTITAGVGDVVSGGDRADTFVLDFAQTSSSGSDTITIDGGTGAGNGADDDTLDLTGRGNFTLSNVTADADGDSTSGTATYDSGQTVSFTEIENIFTCFTPGNLIQTDRGEVPVESLVVGDLVQTRDRGLQPIRWIGSRRLDAIDLAVAPKLRPIRIKAGAMGDDLPRQDLDLSPQHRVLMASKIVERVFDTEEILVPVKKLLEADGIDVVEASEGTTYFHLLFEQHEVIYANGLPAESLYLGPQALKAITPQARAEVVALFPEVLRDDFVPTSARQLPAKGKTIANLVARHKRNNHALVQ